MVGAGGNKAGDRGVEPEDALTLADRLRRLLNARGFTIYAAAEVAGMERQQAWRIVAGKTPNPGIVTVERLVAAIGATMNDLYADDDR